MNIEPTRPTVKNPPVRRHLIRAQLVVSECRECGEMTLDVTPERPRRDHPGDIAMTLSWPG